MDELPRLGRATAGRSACRHRELTAHLVLLPPEPRRVGLPPPDLSPHDPQAATADQPHEGWCERHLRLVVAVGALIGVAAALALLGWRLYRGASPPEPPPLPEGCSWVREPTEGCPVDDAKAYEKWAKRNGPLAVRQAQSGIELVWVPGGTFAMGSDDGNRDEQPVHRVRLNGFWMGRTEVTVKQWRAVMDSVIGPDNDQGDDHPIVDVSWEDCQAFCRKAQLALPTEAQWEFAARGPRGSTYPWGDWWAGTLCRSAEGRKGHARTAPVGSFPQGASWCGALDMAGNVLEWCRDWYAKDFYASSEARRSNPECADTASGNHVLRGGSWFNYADSCRSAARAWNFPWLQDFDVGLRVARAR
jgi:formylglycine-generating enzyme required for sulfatase activity